MKQQPASQRSQRKGVGPAPPAPPFQLMLDEFFDFQMQDVSVREIVVSTAGIVALCAFFMGANQALARQQRVKNKIAHAAMVNCLVNRLGMTEFNAEGLISANELWLKNIC